jgi:hypothetical protein
VAISFVLPNAQLIPTFNATMALQSWLRPGLLAYIVGAHAEAMRLYAIKLQTERNAMLDEFALKYPDVVEDTGSAHPAFIDGKSYNAGDPHPLAGQNVTYTDANGSTVVRFTSKEAGAEFVAREKALMGATTTITVEERLTFEHMKKLDTERLATPRAISGQPAAEMAVDFQSLALLMAAPLAHDANGVAAPATAPSNGTRTLPALVSP